ncbi:MAG: SGNH/GDSL hydrolase family protein [Lentisphaeria bacterium]|nr:SGNH/GDSL hydrolase family protein [Lentisphaeria bacterium]
MLIQLQEHPELFHGIDSIAAAPEGFVPLRMTPALQDCYAGTEHAIIRARSTTGVRLIFRTDSPFVMLQARFLRAARELYYFSVRIDSRPFEVYGPESRTPDYTLSLELPGDGAIHRVEIHLPHLVETAICGLAVADGAAVKPVRTAPKIIFIGDSITQGMTVSAPHRTFYARIAAFHRCDFRNICVGGADTSAAAGRLACAIPWKMAIYAFGTNDHAHNTPLDTLTAEVTGALKALCRRRSAKIVVQTPLWRADAPPVAEKQPNQLGLLLQDYRDTIAAVAREFPVTLIDGRDLLPADPAFFVDGLHPNDAGAERIAAALLEQLPDLD